jgi:hypothetical protein
LTYHNAVIILLERCEVKGTLLFDADGDLEFSGGTNKGKFHLGFIVHTADAFLGSRQLAIVCFQKEKDGKR